MKKAFTILSVLTVVAFAPVAFAGDCASAKAKTCGSCSGKKAVTKVSTDAKGGQILIAKR